MYFDVAYLYSTDGVACVDQDRAMYSRNVNINKASRQMCHGQGQSRECESKFSGSVNATVNPVFKYWVISLFIILQ